MSRPSITALLGERGLLIDGAMGTQIQQYNLTESDFRGEEFASHPIRQMGNNDLLVLSRPDVVAAIHRAYLEAGADIIETCTFSSQAISQAEYGMAGEVRRLNLAAATIARTEAERMSALTPSRPRFVAGSIGPTGHTLSMSSDIENPSARDLDFDTLCQAYIEQIDALVEGGVDLLLVETVFDTLNAKAAFAAASEVFERRGVRLPIILSVTVADASGRMLAGQSLEAMLASVAHVDLLAVGLNCSFGPDEMLPLLGRLSAIAPCYISAYPNAGLPDAMGRYTTSPEDMAEAVGRFLDEGVVNIVGGCCGSTPAHIAAIAAVVARKSKVRQRLEGRVAWLAGLERFDCGESLTCVGERCNVAGSRRFLRLIKEGAYDEALAIARAQVRDGAEIIDVNMDDALLDSVVQMQTFLRLMASDPEVAAVPFMIDSSRFEVVATALKCVQGKAIVNSLALTEGEQLFLERARRVRDLGAALVVMAFDEEGQATTFERKVAVCHRAYKLLTERLGFAPRDIIFDPNILTIATGIAEHDGYALDFIRATEWIHANLPGARVSGGISNLSFALRGNNLLREAMHSVFLHHAVAAGLDMAIVNPSTRIAYDSIPQTLCESLEDVVLARRADATERLLAIADNYREGFATTATTSTVAKAERNTQSLDERLVEALRRGDESHLEADLAEALAEGRTPSAIIDGPLMEGMTLVGECFGRGEMFLPQVVRTARTMKRAVEILRPAIEAAKSLECGVSNGRWLLATVKGDVHDIGKNIAAVVLGCNNFEVIDLGVMVSAERIVEAALEYRPDFIGLSGLITPSLDEMCGVAEALREAGIDVPLFIGGATTSPLHTAVRIAPLYGGAVFHVKDAAQNPILAMRLCGAERETAIADLQAEQERRRAEYAASMQPQGVAQPSERIAIDWSSERIVRPSMLGVQSIENIDIALVRDFINWRHFYNLWGVAPSSAEGDRLRAEAEQALDLYQTRYAMRARIGLFEAHSSGEAILFEHRGGCDCCHHPRASVTLPTPRQRRASAEGAPLALCDFVAPEGDYVGAFAVTVSQSFAERVEELKRNGEQYEALLMQSLGDRLAEAASEWLHAEVRRKWWGYAPDENLTPHEMFAAAYDGIRPAVGYPSLPDQRAIFILDKLLDLSQIGITLTENGAMRPLASVCGLYIASARAHYFIV